MERVFVVCGSIVGSNTQQQRECIQINMAEMAILPPGKASAFGNKYAEIVIANARDVSTIQNKFKVNDCMFHQTQNALFATNACTIRVHTMRRTFAE